VKEYRMMFERTYKVKDNNQLVIKLPDSFKSSKRVRVIVEVIDEERKSKIDYLKRAAEDPLFLSDIQEVEDDFQYSDKETL
jgi:hypothetical protein